MAINFTDAIGIIRDKTVIGVAKFGINFDKGVDTIADKTVITGYKVGKAVNAGGEKVKEAAAWVGDQVIQVALIALGALLLVGLLFGRD